MGTFQLRIVLLLALMFLVQGVSGWCFTTGAETATQNQLDSLPVVTWNLDEQFQLLNRDIPPRNVVSQIEIEPKHITDYRATEWRISLKPNSLTTPTIITNLSSADLDIVFPNSRPINLHWSEGSHGLASDFQPHTEKLHSGNTRTFESIGGRSSDGVMPYFQIENGDGGLIIAIGWSGD